MCPNHTQQSPLAEGNLIRSKGHFHYDEACLCKAFKVVQRGNTDQLTFLIHFISLYDKRYEIKSRNLF